MAKNKENKKDLQLENQAEDLFIETEPEEPKKAEE